VNCTETCITGSCRGPSRPLCRRPEQHTTLHMEPYLEETGQVWTEAGFLPPADYRRAVALLHRLAMDEEIVTSFLSDTIRATAAKQGSAGRGYRILDPVKLRRIAEDYGIEQTGGDDSRLAHAVTLAIIGEYRASTPEGDA